MCEESRRAIEALLRSDSPPGSLKTALADMGVGTVRAALDAQRRYTRKRRREHAEQAISGEDIIVRKCAKALNINLGKLVEDLSGNGTKRWWHKGRSELIEDILCEVAIHDDSRRKALRASQGSGHTGLGGATARVKRRVVGKQRPIC